MGSNSVKYILWLFVVAVLFSSSVEEVRAGKTHIFDNNNLRNFTLFSPGNERPLNYVYI